MAGSINARKLVVVEGAEEERFLYALMKHLDMVDVEVRGMGGKSEWSNKLKALKQTPGFGNVVSLGLIRDADTDATGTFTSMVNALRSVQLPMPNKPLERAEGTGGLPATVVLVLPHDSCNGMLEDVCLRSIVKDQAYSCMESYFDCIQSRLKVLPKIMAKAKIHAFLATREEPDKRLGEAAEKGYWPWGSPAFDCFKQFLNLL
ncbi:MAG: DUF3226 domain-containing protein [Dehalococcoidia bacterium]|jgi:hypothetical protein